MREAWQLWANHLSPQTCDEIIQKGLVIPPRSAAIGFGKDARSDEGFRRSNVRWIPRRSEEWRWVVELIEHLVRISNRNAFGFDLDYVHEIQFTEYSADYEGHYNWHEDLEWVSNLPVHRKVSFVLQLSDPNSYEGGKLELRLPDGSSLPEGVHNRGSILVFPSFWKHRVTPVTRGVRYSLVAWYEGPQFR